jgi:hypothetical protein
MSRRLTPKEKRAKPAPKEAKFSTRAEPEEAMKDAPDHPVPRFTESGDPAPLGGVTREDLAAVVASSFGMYPELEAPEVRIAVETLAKALAARMRHAGWTSDPKLLAVFLITDRARELGNKIAATREPIIDNGSKPFGGRLWVASNNFTSGYWLPFRGGDDAAVFGEVEMMGFGDHPAIVFDPSATDLELRYYPRGLSDMDRVHRFVIAQYNFTLESLDKVLKRFHEYNIITPDAVLGEQDPWKKASHYFPRPNTESFLQGWLKSVLSVAFLDHIIRFEVRGNEGRCDLLVVSPHKSQANAWLYHAALELKVLRSFTAGGKSVPATKSAKAVSDGLLQAIAYKREHAAELGMLCCFDMRVPKHCNGDGCFAGIGKKAEKNLIELRRYRLYGSSADLRADKYGGAGSRAP